MYYLSIVDRIRVSACEQSEIVNSKSYMKNVKFTSLNVSLIKCGSRKCFYIHFMVSLIRNSTKKKEIVRPHPAKSITVSNAL